MVSQLRKLDGVSGATLTSLAIAEAVVQRLGGVPRSLRFPHPVTLEEVGAVLPAAAELRAEVDQMKVDFHSLVRFCRPVHDIDSLPAPPPPSLP